MTTNHDDHQTPAPSDGERSQFGPRAGARGRGAKKAALAELDAQAVETFRAGFSAERLVWNTAARAYVGVPDIWARLTTLKTYLEFRSSMPKRLRARVAADFKGRHRELLEISATPAGRALLLKIGAVNEDWLRRYAPTAQ
jgi:hypothetical protein